MKKLIPTRLIIATVFFLFATASNSFAFDYKISFTASGQKSSIDYVVVLNLTRGTTSTITGGNLLELTALQQTLANNESLKIYPNPIQNYASVSYFSYSGGYVKLNIIGIDGRCLTGISKKLEIGENFFELTLPKGAYTLQINDNGQIHSAKIISQSSNTARIDFVGSDIIKPQEIQKAKTSSVPMQYNLGDIILFKAYSGNYISILTDIVSGDKTINFNFVECKDVDGNYYSTVTIGNQVWMAENLKTSKYRNGTSISDKTNLSTWGTSTTEAYSDYASPGNSTTFGKLYNWFAASNSNNLAPLGWHVPTDADWTTLSDFLGGQNLAGDKLKENGNINWTTLNSTATNSTGFTALPGGSKSTDNTVYDTGNIGYWWSASEGTTTTNGWYRSLSNQNGTFTRGYYSKAGGMSIRCLMGDLPIVTTSTVSSVTTTSFASGGEISYEGNYPVTSSGICWSTSSNPTINDSKTSDWNGNGTFTSSVSGLTPQTTYYVRAYATNSYGTGYGSQLTISTSTPTITTTTISSISSTTAIGGGTVSIITGAPSVTSRGICWSINPNPTIDDNKTSNGTGIGAFTSSLTGLNPETVYYVRAYAINSVGVKYGAQVTFSTKLPIITTSAISSITNNSANCGGNITSVGGSAITASGVCWSTSPNPTISNSKTTDGAGTGSFTSYIYGLSVGTTYYIRAYATNSIGTSYGNEITFSTFLPTISTNSITNITSTTASCGGNVTDIGGAAVTSRGVCWSTSSSPTISNSKTTDGTGSGVFTSSITGLSVGNTYYIRAYATSSIGTVYGSEITFSTKLATVTTTSASSITANAATLGGSITNIGGADVSERGICWSTSTNPTISNSKTTDGSGIGSYTSNITGLTAETTYYVRAYATNSIGTAYGSQITISTALPVLTTTSISSITSTNAISGGNATLATGAGAVTERGVCWSTIQNPTIANSKSSDGSGVGTYTSSIIGLSGETTYYVRAYATNGAGTAYGSQVSFSTKLPTLTTTAVSSITASTATSGGNITDIGGAAVTARGVCWSTNTSPTTSNNKTTDSSGSGVFSSIITGLTVGTTYYVRAYATNSIGTVYGNEVSFSTNLPTVTTTALSNITDISASSGGNITNSGGSTVTAKGICWSTSVNPTISNNKTSNGNGSSSFTSDITGLTAETTYYVRAYATNSIGTSYGQQLSLTTTKPPVIPTITTNEISSITSISANSGGVITNDGGATVTARGICWSTSTSPNISNNITTDGVGTGTFTSNITGLTPGEVYYARAYATNRAGTAYGSTLVICTLPTSYSVGNSYLGGIIAYIDNSGKHGFVCATSDQSIGTTWSNISSVLFGANNTDLETVGIYGISKSGGRKNTDLIISNCGTGTYAAALCAALTIGGANIGDWYLPSKGELNQIYINRIILGIMTGATYWSSSEYNANNSWTQDFSTYGSGYQGARAKNDKTAWPAYVRAIRAF